MTVQLTRRKVEVLALCNVLQAAAVVVVLRSASHIDVLDARAGIHVLLYIGTVCGVYRLQIIGPLMTSL